MGRHKRSNLRHGQARADCPEQEKKNRPSRRPRHYGGGNHSLLQWTGDPVVKCLARLGTHPEEHHDVRIKKARNAQIRLRRLAGQVGLSPENCRRVQAACVQAGALFARSCGGREKTPMAPRTDRRTSRSSSIKRQESLDYQPGSPQLGIQTPARTTATVPRMLKRKRRNSPPRGTQPLSRQLSR